MNSILEELRGFVDRNKHDPNTSELYLLTDGGRSKISYSIARDIIEVVDSLRMTTNSLQITCEELRDYNRLLRKENNELKN